MPYKIIPRYGIGAGPQRKVFDQEASIDPRSTQYPRLSEVSVSSVACNLRPDIALQLDRRIVLARVPYEYTWYRYVLYTNEVNQNQRCARLCSFQSQVLANWW